MERFPKDFCSFAKQTDNMKWVRQQIYHEFVKNQKSECFFTKGVEILDTKQKKILISELYKRFPGKIRVFLPHMKNGADPYSKLYDPGDNTIDLDRYYIWKIELKY